jgi:hypothetical protein
MILVLVSVACELSGPFIVNLLLNYLQDCEDSSDDEKDDLVNPTRFFGSDDGGSKCGVSWGLVYVALLSGTQLTNAVVRAHSMYWIKQVGISVRTCLMTVIFHKSLTIGPKARAEASAGKLINQMAADAQRFLFVMPPIQNLLCVPIYLVYVCGYLYLYVVAMPRNTRLSSAHGHAATTNRSYPTLIHTDTATATPRTGCWEWSRSAGWWSCFY